MKFQIISFSKKNIALALVLILSGMCLCAQNQKKDSLWQVFDNTRLHDTIRLNALHSIAWDYINIYPDSAYIIATKQLNYAKKIENKFWQIDALNTMGYYYYVIGNYQKALEIYFLSIEKLQMLDKKKTLADVYSAVGYVYSSLSDFPKALDYFFKALAISQKIGAKKTEASVSIGIGNIYVIQLEYTKAKKHFLNALQIGNTINNKELQGVCFVGLGNVNYRNKNYNQALDYYLKALKINEELGNKLGQINNIGNIGGVYLTMGDLQKALDHFFQAVEISQEIGEKEMSTTYLRNIGLTYVKLKKYRDAEKYLNKSMTQANDLKSLELIKEVHLLLFELYELTGRPTLALDHYKKYIIYKDSVYNNENIKKQTHTEIQYEFDRKEMIAKVEQEKKDAVALKEKQQQQVIVYITSGGLLIFLLLAVFIYKGYSQKKKLSLNLAHKNQEITDSINYAKRIQEAILPTEDEFKTAFPDSFILFKPKDIVSGDFYWISTNPKEFPSIDKEHGSNSWRVKNPLVAAVDCTGHGVPGSLMSMMGNSLLNKIVDTHKISKPNEILNLLRTEIINSLKQHGENENKDGMDIALCTVYDDKIEFAGANNPIYIIRKNGNLEEIKADKMPVGYSGVELKPYTNHSVKMEQGDSFYIFTDGYADQFGGKDNKKFKYKQFKDLLVTINSKSMQKQKEILNETIENWKGTNEQTDDILVIGIRI